MAESREEDATSPNTVPANATTTTTAAASDDLFSESESIREEEREPSEEAANPAHRPLIDRHNRAIAEILTRFRNMVMAATAPLPQTNIIEQAALNRMIMERETAALITEVQGLFALNREIKKLWIQGPLRKPGEDKARDDEITRKAQRASELYSQLIDRENEQRAQQPGAEPAAPTAADLEKARRKREKRKAAKKARKAKKKNGGGEEEDAKEKKDDGNDEKEEGTGDDGAGGAKLKVEQGA